MWWELVSSLTQAELTESPAPSVPPERPFLLVGLQLGGSLAGPVLPVQGFPGCGGIRVVFPRTGAVAAL